MTESFYYFEDPVKMTTSLLRPGFYGPMVVALMRFHCILLLSNVYCLSLSGEGKLISKDGTVYEGSFHNHRRHGEGKLMFRLGAVITQAHNRHYSWYPLSLHVLKDLCDKSNVISQGTNKCKNLAMQDIVVEFVHSRQQKMKNFSS